MESSDEDEESFLIDSKFLTREVHNELGLKIGTCEMRGWRPTMEDAMSKKLGFSPGKVSKSAYLLSYVLLFISCSCII